MVDLIIYATPAFVLLLTVELFSSSTRATTSWSGPLRADGRGGGTRG
ncbi:MAG TPA: hypothetical protein VNP96_02745 [Solirubrobacterales bacterium]|nr:hypothetical protein [Solirubrobacterales bacterium]